METSTCTKCFFVVFFFFFLQFFLASFGTGDLLNIPFPQLCVIIFHIAHY